MTQLGLLAQRDRVFLRDAGNGARGRVPVLTAEHFAMGADGIEVRLNLRLGGTVCFSGRLLTHWLLGSEDYPVTRREQPDDLVLAEVLRGGRVAVRTFFNETTGVMLLLVVTEAARQ